MTTPPTPPPVTKRSLADEAEKIARRIAVDRLPPDAGAIGMLRDTVARAYEAGQKDELSVVLAAYQEFLDSDDLDVFRDVLTDLMESAGLSAPPSASGEATGTEAKES
jgi:hypothetical protein